MSGFDAIAWDIDGTLLDSEPVHLRAQQEVSLRHGVDLSGEPDDRFLGLDLDRVWQQLKHRYPPDLRQSSWTEAILLEYCGRSHEIVVYDDMIALMGEFAHAGVPQACVSNSERLIVDTNLSALGIGGIVAFLISRQDVLRGKPDPAPYLEAYRRLGVTPARVLAVEDSDPGAWAAEAAGLAVVRVEPTGRAGAIADIRAIACQSEIPAVSIGPRDEVRAATEKSRAKQPTR